MHPHEMPHVKDYGRSPGNGMSHAHLSHAPLATEAEAKIPDADGMDGAERDDDAFIYDEVGEELDDLLLPTLGDGPRF